MLFNSLQFALFLPVVFALYWLLRRSLRWQNALVLVASYVFYGWWDWRFLLLIVFSSGVAYAAGRLMERGRYRRLAMWGCVVANLGVLAVFKYYDFFASQLAHLLGLPAERWMIGLVLPVGISFYTFQALSYAIDVYRGTLRPTRDVVAFFSYVSFFPQLVAGPIERATNLLPQFEQPRRFDYAQAVDGCRQMLWGLFKKMVVADNCALYVDQVFANGGAPSEHFVAMLFFSIQIYCDFSGYSSVAIGVAKLFGIRLMQNFRVPYFSRDIAEFWRRWHISLTTWFRDYVYIPLGGSRVGRWKVVRNTFVIFLVSGLWHGAQWTFIVWGLFHAILFLPLILLGRNRRYTDTVAQGRLFPTWREAAQMLLTFTLVAIGWVFFRAPDLSSALHYLQTLFHSEALKGFWLLIRMKECRVGFYMALLMLGVEWINRDAPHELARLPRQRWVRWVGYIVLVYLIVAFMPTHELPFIYFQF